MRKPTALVLAAALLVGAPAVTGCSLIGNFLPGGNPVGGVIPGVGVPGDFPKDDVPLIDGEVVLGLAVPGDSGEKAWNVTIKVSGADAFDTIKDELTGAGFEYQELGSSGDGASGGFTKDPYTVIVVVTQADGDWTANYTVTNAADG